MASTRNQLIARLHCIRRENGWSEDEYRDIIQLKTKTETHPGYRSAKDIPSPMLARLVAELGEQKPAPAARRTNEWSWVDTAPSDRIKRLRYIIVLAGKLGVERGGQKRYVEGIAENMDSAVRVWKDGKHAKDHPHAVKKPLEFCTFDELANIINALEAQVKRAENKQGGKK